MLRRLVAVLALLTVVAVSIPVVTVAPYVRDDIVLDRIVHAVVLDWRDFGEEKARERLKYELDHQEIGMYVPDESCVLVEEADLKVRCAWSVEAVVPLVGVAIPLRFQSEASVSP